jgi:hypothetical protein
MFSFLRKLFKGDPVKAAPVLDPTEVCDDCGAADGALHDLFCTREQCPFCRRQLITCDCKKTILNLTPEEVEAVDEYMDDSVEPLKSIAERWKTALEQRGRVPFRGWKLEATADDLILMAARGEVEAVGRLLARGVPVDATNDVQHTALMSAANNCQLQVVEFLLERGANVSRRNAYGLSPLHCAVGFPPYDAQRQAQIVTVLLAQGAELDGQSQSGGTPLMNAAWFGCTPSVAVLLKAGAKLELHDQKGQKAEDLAAKRKHGEIVEMLRTYDTR